jgi:hypothetical protein
VAAVLWRQRRRHWRPRRLVLPGSCWNQFPRRMRRWTHRGRWPSRDTKGSREGADVQLAWRIRVDSRASAVVVHRERFDDVDVHASHRACIVRAPGEEHHARRPTSAHSCRVTAGSRGRRTSTSSQASAALPRGACRPWSLRLFARAIGGEPAGAWVASWVYTARLLISHLDPPKDGLCHSRHVEYDDCRATCR